MSNHATLRALLHDVRVARMHWQCACRYGEALSVRRLYAEQLATALAALVAAYRK